MAEPIDFTHYHRAAAIPADHREDAERLKARGRPSNAVYARVGDTILRAAQDGVRRHLPAQDIVREIVAEYDVHLTVGELRLLLAARRIPE